MLSIDQEMFEKMLSFLLLIILQILFKSRNNDTFYNEAFIFKIFEQPTKDGQLIQQQILKIIQLP